MRIDFTNKKRVVWNFVIVGLVQLIALASHFVVLPLETALIDGLWSFMCGIFLVGGVVCTNLMYQYGNFLKTES